MDQVPPAERSVNRAGLEVVHQQGTVSASVTLADETRRALTPPLPARLTFAVKIPSDPIMQFAIAEMFQEELYDLASEPEERHSLEDSPQMEAFRRELHAYLEEAKMYQAGEGKGEAVVLDEAARERLRSLGYIQ